jgi:hypothetical protein
MTNSSNVVKFEPPAQKNTEQSWAQTLVKSLSQEESTGGGDDESLTSVHQFQSLIKRLNEVFTEAKKHDWDGENAEPVSDATYHNATRLLSALPVSLPSPEILPDNDGYIEFEWHKNGKSFSLYVTDTNLVLFAGFYGKEDRLSGRFNYEEDFPIRAELLAKDVYKETSQQ